MKTKVNNRSDEHLVVKSLNVLTDIKGGGISQIRDTVKELQNSQSVLAQQQSDYWSGIASDNVISPEEKKILYKEYQEIKSERPAILEEAQKAGIPDEAEVLVDYKNAYDALYNLLEVQLKVFDRMDKDTRLEDREAFIQAYIRYYDTRNTLRSGTYTSASTYILDLSPDYIGVPCTNKGIWINPQTEIKCDVVLLKGIDGTDYAVTRQALYNGQVIGSWDRNTLTIPLSVLTQDTNAVKINVKDITGVSLSASLIVSKLYQADADWKIYGIDLSDNSVKVIGGNPEPAFITAKKVVSSEAEIKAPTNYGRLEASVEGQESVLLDTWQPDAGDEYRATVEYGVKMQPFYLTLEGLALCTPEKKVMISYYRKKEL